MLQAHWLLITSCVKSKKLVCKVVWQDIDRDSKCQNGKQELKTTLLKWPRADICTAGKEEDEECSN